MISKIKVRSKGREEFVIIMDKTPGSPLTQRIQNKSWKVRAEVYGEILQNVKSNKMEMHSCARYIVPMISDANPQVT